MKAKRQKYQRGSVVLDARTNIWYYRWKDHATGKRRAVRLGTSRDIPTKAKAIRLAEGYRSTANQTTPGQTVSFEAAARRYMAERMPKRHTTGGGYRNNLEKYVIPKWGAIDLGAVKPLAVDQWFNSLPLAQKTKTHVKSVMRQVFEYAMLCELFDMQRNPMDLVRITGGTLRDKDPIILTPEQFGRLLQHIISEPHRTMVIAAMCLGLRRSELVGLKWSDFDWLNQEVMIQRSVIANRVDAVKTKKSKARLPLAPELVKALQEWRKISQFNQDNDWVWASPWVAGAMPYYPNAVQRDHIIPAGESCGLGRIGWHTFRHTYRTWMGSNGTPLGIQKDLMRHADIKTTMNVYGGSMPQEMRDANAAVVKMAIQ
jgi:integrase